MLLPLTYYLCGCMQEVASRLHGVHTSSTLSEDSGIEVGILLYSNIFLIF